MFWSLMQFIQGSLAHRESVPTFAISSGMYVHKLKSVEMIIYRNHYTYISALLHTV